MPMVLKHESPFRVNFNIRRWRLIVGMSSNKVHTSITDVEVCEPMYNVSPLINVEFADVHDLQSESAFHWLLHSNFGRC